MDQAPVPDIYARLLELLDRHGARYRLIEHPSEGRTEIVSTLRGHDPRDAAKCMILMVKVGRRVTRHVLAVVPGNRRVSFDAARLDRSLALNAADYPPVATPRIEHVCHEP